MRNKLFELSLLAVLYGCTFNQLEPPMDCELSGLQLSLIRKSDANCSLSDGSVEIAANEGTGDYIFSLSGFPDQTNGLFSVPAGNHTFSVTDSKGCTDQISVSVGNIGGVIIDAIEKQDSGCKASNGQIIITASGGDMPYEYKLGNGNFQANNIFPSLPSGNHEVTVKDATDCEFTQEVLIATGVSFSTTISPIISSNCAISGCHNGSQFPDFRNFSNIQSNASNIKSRTSSGSMPLGGSLTQQQKDNIACWVDDGALNN